MYSVVWNNKKDCTNQCYENIEYLIDLGRQTNTFIEKKNEEVHHDILYNPILDLLEMMNTPTNIEQIKVGIKKCGGNLK